MPDVHAQLSASGSAKWLPCSAALALEAILNVPDTGSSFASEGTAAHELLERCLTLDEEPTNYLGETLKVNGDQEIDVTQEMVDAVEVCVEYCNRLQAKSSFYEEKVDYSHLAPEGFGTADIIKEVYEKTSPSKKVNKLYVIDFKYGKGIRVDAFENTQGMLYGLGSLNTLDMLFEKEIESVVIVIVQPRMDNISEYEISVEALKRWGNEVVKPKALKAFNLVQAAMDEGVDALSEDDFHPTQKGCQWCQGKRTGKCKAFAKLGYEAAIEGFSDLTAEDKKDLATVEVSKETIKSASLLGNDELAAVHKSMKMFMAFAKDLDKEIVKRLAKGETVPGLALEPTLKARAWSLDDAGVAKALRTAGLKKPDYEVTKLITPTQAQAKLRKIRPKDHEKRYTKLEAACIERAPGNDKIIEIDDQADDLFD